MILSAQARVFGTRPDLPKVGGSHTPCLHPLLDNEFLLLKDSKRISKNIYARTREECEEKLAELIVQMKAEIEAEKERKNVKN